MSRILIQIILPLMAPLMVYALWVWYGRKRAETSGDEPPEFTKGSSFWSIILGFILMIISMVWLATSHGVSPDSGVYEAPKFIDGKITEPTYTPQTTTDETN